jgi:PKD repeat protein
MQIYSKNQAGGKQNCFAPLILILILCFPFSARAQTITVSPSSANVEEDITFTLNPFPYTPSGQILWDFGDGRSALLGLTYITGYTTEGTFTVTASFSDVNGFQRSAQTSVTTTENRRLEYVPAKPRINDRVTLQAVNFNNPAYVIWDFGDRSSSITGSWTQNHSYTEPGTYTVKARDSSDSVHLFTAAVTVHPPPEITFAPEKPRIGERVTFTAEYFFSNSRIRWDFGDGTIENDDTPPNIVHTYNRAGTFQVRAYDGGGNIITASVNVQIYPKATITFSPEKSRIGQQVTFTARNFFSSSLIRWDFGDGTIINDTTPPSATHVYNNPGRYEVKAYDGGGGIITAAVSIQIYPVASITCAPDMPRIGEQITFTANDFFSATLIRWDFGDGTVVNDSSPPSITHSYSNTGTYQVRAFDDGGAAVTCSLVLTVMPPRLISFSPKIPRTGESVLFHALNFISPVLQWDFGDGSPSEQGGVTLTHTYRKSGTFTVTVSDIQDNLPVPVSSVINVVEASGPRAPFSISYINLRFEDGLSYKAVPKDFSPLVAYADIKYEGTGILVAQWMVDGNPFKMISESLVQAEDFVFNTGNLPGLPTLSPGIHEITLNIIQPPADFTIPVIRYYVSIEKNEGKEILEPGQLNLIASKAKGLENEDITISGDTIEVPLNKPFLLNGTVKNEAGRIIPVVLLRIYLDDKMIDQKALRDMKAAEERPYETSVFISSEDTKAIFVRLYDISADVPRLISSIELTVVIR